MPDQEFKCLHKRLVTLVVDVGSFAMAVRAQAATGLLVKAAAVVKPVWYSLIACTCGTKKACNPNRC